MKILHILRSAPNDLVRFFIAAMGGNQNEEVALEGGPVDYDRLVARIFESDRVICWW